MKNFKLIGVCIALFFSQNALSANYLQDSNLENVHFLIGPMYAFDSFWINAGVIQEHFVARLAGKGYTIGNKLFERAPMRHSGGSRGKGRLELDLRQPVTANAGFECGFVGVYGNGYSNDPLSNRDTYSLGFIVGIDYILKEHFQFHMGVLPYDYFRSKSAEKENSYFTEGVIGFDYIF